MEKMIYVDVVMSVVLLVDDDMDTAEVVRCLEISSGVLGACVVDGEVKSYEVKNKQ